MKKLLLFSLWASLFLCAAIADDVGVRLRLGLTDKEATDWSGTVTVAPGKVTLISGWRFAQQDKVDGVTAWSCRTRPQALDKRRSNNPTKEQKRPEAATALPMADNGVLISLTDVTEQSQVSVKTAQGEFAFKLADLPFGKYAEQLGGAVEVERTAAAQQLTNDGKADDDYPSAAVGADGTAWIASQSFTPGLGRDERAKSYEKEPGDMTFLAKPAGGDQLWLRWMKGHQSGEPIAITPPGRDIYKSAVAVDGKGVVWVFWAENAGYKAFPKNPLPNFDIWARSLKDGKLSEPIQISNSPENDIWPVVATDAQGDVLKGYKFAFQSSSDHGSYALVYAEAPTRDAILKAMKQRHVYAATDNIVADFRCGEHMMGDEFSASTAPQFRIHLEGTAPFKKVVFVKDDTEIFTAEPKQAKCDVEWTDPKPEAGKTSYYYVRGEQENGELVWASPMWIKFEPAK